MKEAKTRIPDLLAEMVAVDGKVLEVEELNAEALIECFAKGLGADEDGTDINIDEAKARFFASLKLDAGDAAADPASLLERFGHLPTSVKLDLFRAIWMIATCDGELHPEEERLVRRFADMIALARSASAAQQSSTDNTGLLKKAS